MTAPAVQQMWAPTAVRNALTDGRGHRARPSWGITAVLTALAGLEPTHGAALARAAGQDQGNTVRYLAQLEARGFAERVEHVPGLGRNGGGRPAVIWALTGAGRALVAALRAENGVAA